MTRSLVLAFPWLCARVTLFRRPSRRRSLHRAGEATKNAGSVVATTPSAEPTAAISHDAESAVVKVFATIRHPDLLEARGPSRRPRKSPAAASVIEGHRILTNAHVVLTPARSRSRPTRPATSSSPPSRPSRRASTSPCSRWTTTPSSTPAAPAARERAAAHQGRRDGLRLPEGGTACPSPRASSRASSSCPTTRPCRACASRSTPPSTPATPAARPSSATT